MHSKEPRDAPKPKRKIEHNNRPNLQLTRPSKYNQHQRRTILGKRPHPCHPCLGIGSSPIKTPNGHCKFNRNRWEEWNEDIESNTTPGILTAAETPNEAYQSFYNAIIEASNKHFKSKRKNKEPKKPWWTPLCKKTTKEARKAYKLWRSTFLPSDKNNLNKLEAIKKRTIMAAKNQT
jgi:hypothetical protein